MLHKVHQTCTIPHCSLCNYTFQQIWLFFKYLAIFVKSIFAKVKIKKGETFSENNLIVKRPGNGLSPIKWDEILGSKATKDYNEDELI